MLFFNQNLLQKFYVVLLLFTDLPLQKTSLFAVGRWNDKLTKRIINIPG